MNAILLAVPLLVAAPVPKDFRPARTSVDGTWVFVSATSGGNPDALYDGATWVLGADGRGTRHLRGDTGTPIEYKTDPKAKTFDWTHSGSTWYGIYEIKGDTMRVALSLSETRPAAFGGPGVYVFTMKKVKK